ncbi:MAG: TPR domain protein [Candidatus Ozemobacter sibiricus]|uniref:TPR domain protein n=1 Tax=Candidatus Ozemobacter sibiricus TaxID=2268124 RepID=A0A367ZRX7_9BACT|nr:MAG: TPR domain protein [Candidatus Ozemobacter sibiricus]
MGLLVVLLASWGCLWSVPARAETIDLDFGLPLFGLEEIRLEREKAPDFNLVLLKKYLSENENNTLAPLAALMRWMALIRLSDEQKAATLRRLVLDLFKNGDLTKRPRQEVLNELWIRGLLLAADKEPDPKNLKDHEFEDFLLKAEDILAGQPEYFLVKGVLFHALRHRPNGFFSPMRPLEDLKKALGLAPAQDAHFFFVVGQALRLLGTQENSLYLAIGAYEKAASLMPTNGRLQNTLLGIYMGLHESYQAMKKPEPFWLEEAVYKKILTLFPNNPHALNNLGFLYAEYGLHRELAQSLCQRAVDRMPDNASFRDSLGWAAFKNQQYEKAETELRKSIELNPDAYEPYYHLGTLYYVTRKYELAIANYEKALQIKPDAPETLNNFAYLLAELDRDIDKALAMATKAVKLEPANASYLDTLGWVYYRLGRYDEAQRYLQKALQLTPEVGEILVHLGKVFLEQGKFGQALDYIKQAHRVDPRLDNIEQDLYLAITLKAQYGALEEYHRLFGAQVDPDKIKRILLTLVGVYQGEGLYAHAIRLTKLCEAIQRREIDLARPLFDFYRLDPASAAVAVGSQTAAPTARPADRPTEGAGADEAVARGGEEEAEPPMPIALPPVVKAGLAVHLGPVLFEQIAAHLLAFPGFEQLALTLVVPDLGAPAASAWFDLQMPGLANRDPLGVVSYALRLLGAEEVPISVASEGRRLQARLGRLEVWAIQQAGHLMMGFGPTVPAIDVAALEATFPYAADCLIGLFLDWPTCLDALPRLVRPFLPNPVAPFQVVLSRFFWTNEGFRESSLLVPGMDVTPGFLQSLARDLFAYKVMLLRLGFNPSIQVKARDGLIQLEAGYGGLPSRWQAWWTAVQPLRLLLKSRLDAWACALRRVFFGGPLEDLDKICPAGGQISVNGPTGALECSIHQGFALFPLPGLARDRCAYSRRRLTEMFQRLSPRILKELSPDELRKRFQMDYNIPPCPAGGEFFFDEQSRVRCTIHQDGDHKTGLPASAPPKDDQNKTEQER